MILGSIRGRMFLMRLPSEMGCACASGVGLEPSFGFPWCFLGHPAKEDREVVSMKSRTSLFLFLFESQEARNQATTIKVNRLAHILFIETPRGGVRYA
jgi:hypothetical protein